MRAGKYPVTNKQIEDILQKEMSGVRVTQKPVYNGRIRSQGKTTATVYPWGETKSINAIEIGKQVKDTRECLLDTMLHEELEARILLKKDKSPYYEKLYNGGDKVIHAHIDRVIKKFFDAKGIDYGLA